MFLTAAKDTNEKLMEEVKDLSHRVHAQLKSKFWDCQVGELFT